MAYFKCYSFLTFLLLICLMGLQMGLYLRSVGGGLKIFTGADCDSGGHTVLLICEKRDTLLMQRKHKNSSINPFPLDSEVSQKDLFERLKSN